MKHLFRWNITKETGITIGLGIVMILLSLGMLPFDGDGVFDLAMNILLRDVCMVFGLEICFVLLYCDKRGPKIWNELGIKKERIGISLILNLIFGVLLLVMFLSEGKPDEIIYMGNLYGATYIFVAGIFEMLFIYGFLRRGFEQSFGIIPAIVLTATFYSFHHAGFQPEFLHLFWVGIMYVTVYYITRNLFIIFPFFWGVGALWDVLVDSPAGDSIKNPISFAVAIGILFGVILVRMYQKKRNEKDNAI